MEATEPAVKVKRDVSEGEKWKNAKQEEEEGGRRKSIGEVKGDIKVKGGVEK